MSKHHAQKVMSPKYDAFLQEIIHESWKKIAPFWPIKNLVAVNPLQGFEDLPIESALYQGATFFQITDFPKPLQDINRLTIQWMPSFFDQGQAFIPMPLRSGGLYTAWKKLAYFDVHMHQGDSEKKKWLLDLPESSQEAIAICLDRLKIAESDQCLYLTLLLTSLPGWAAHVQYCTLWADHNPQYSVSPTDYLAVRIIMSTLLWPNGQLLLDWYHQGEKRPLHTATWMQAIEASEKEYRVALFKQWACPTISPCVSKPQAQLIFCIDVRSEPFRKALEDQGPYETFSFSGFFALPVRIKNTITQESHPSCPVFLKPRYTVHESPCSDALIAKNQQGHARLNRWKSIYHACKYNLLWGFASWPCLGFASALWMSLRTFAPIRSHNWRQYGVKKMHGVVGTTPDIQDIPLADQCLYALSALKSMGLTENFAPLVVFCGHGSMTQNNAYATILDCGACGGHHGGHNAQIMAKILNAQPVREALHQQGIMIPNSTTFLAAEHNTTSDLVTLYEDGQPDMTGSDLIKQLKSDWIKAGQMNSARRSIHLGFQGTAYEHAQHTQMRSVDWAQVHPEWGLSGNASLIIAPRQRTKHMDLGGRAFLHSYDYLQDPDGTILERILTAPMIVAQWINSQYLLSTLDTVAYGSGSKVTKNVTGKIGIMQGNASDLMTGLPLQSIYKTDEQVYQKAVRLTVVVYAPPEIIDTIIQNHIILQKLFKNGWILLVCMDPHRPDQPLFLNRDLTWRAHD